MRTQNVREAQPFKLNGRALGAYRSNKESM